MIQLASNTIKTTLSDSSDFYNQLNSIFSSNGKFNVLRFVQNSEIILNSGDSYFGFKKYQDPDNTAKSEIMIQTYTGFDSNKNFHEQPGAIPVRGYGLEDSRNNQVYNGTACCLPDLETEMWMNYSNDKVFCVFKRSNYYFSLYAGFIDRAISPAKYKFPTFAGGSTEGLIITGHPRTYPFKQNVKSYSDKDEFTSNFIFGVGSNVYYDAAPCRSYVRYHDNTQQDITNTNGDYNVTNDEDFKDHDEFPDSAFIFGLGFNRERAARMKSNINQSYEVIKPLIFSKMIAHSKLSITTKPELLGTFYSAFLIASENLDAETVISVNCEDYIVFNDLNNDLDSCKFLMKIE